MAACLESNYAFQKGAYKDNIHNFLALYNEIADVLKQDEELKAMLEFEMDEECYPDLELRTLTIDVAYFISKHVDKKADKAIVDEWWPMDYSPELTESDWVQLLNDKDVFLDSSLEIMKRIFDLGGEASCTQLANKYGKTANFYNTGSFNLAKRVAKKTGCPLIQPRYDSSKWWPILYVGKDAGKEQEGSYIWKLREELKVALEKVDLSKVDLYAKEGSRGVG